MGKAVRSAWVCVLGLVFAAACGSNGGSTGPVGSPPVPPSPSPSSPTPPPPPPVAPGDKALVLIFGSDVLQPVQARVTALITASTKLPVEAGDPNAAPPPLAPDALVLSFGDTFATRSIVDPSSLAALGPEAVVVKSGAISGAPLFAAIGNAPLPATANHGNLGTQYASYALLEQLGFAFLHPLAPTIPAALTVPSAPVDIHESPALRVRGIHLHSMHPLELTEMLQGFGPGGPTDATGWQARLPEWDSFLEWMLANRLNRVEWVLLYSDSWADFADGSTRHDRLKTLVDHAHAVGIAAGADAPLAETQQNTWRLVRTTGNLASELAQIDMRLDWLYSEDFDYFSTESGTTEFTHPDPTEMLAWMNEAATYSKKTYSAPAYVKAHCSTGQTAAPYTDPSTGQPINFNFLPHYADPSLGVMPHTVEIYGLSDPAPTYGNTDFGYMKDFLEQEAGAREVIWHPESAYWITYDIDVPLFLPIYAERRVSDLRALVADDRAGKMGRGAHAGAHMDGQMIFSSGWEWGYWLNDVVAARASFDPHMEAATDRDAFLAVLAPVAKALGNVGDDVATWVADTADAEAALLIDGTVNGASPTDITQANGMAYLEGFDAMADVADLGSALGIPVSPVTQPLRVGLVDMRNPLRGGPSYPDVIAPLLAAMETTFAGLATRGTQLASSAAPVAADLVDDLVDASQMTALRAQQVHGLYDYVSLLDVLGNPTQAGRARLKTARSALDTAAKIVAGREPRYRVDTPRIAGWRDNPTAYSFTYLWTTHSLYFWWRDEGKAVDAPVDPCYLNIMNPALIAFGEGILADTTQAISNALGSLAAECLTPPTSEPTFPQDNLRSRP